MNRKCERVRYRQRAVISFRVVNAEESISKAKRNFSTIKGKFTSFARGDWGGGINKIQSIYIYLSKCKQTKENVDGVTKTASREVKEGIKKKKNVFQEETKS